MARTRPDPVLARPDPSDVEPAVPDGGGGLTRMRLEICYDGAGFHGWARQPGLRTVQGELESSLAMLFRQQVPLTVAGRTDAGVHAEGQIAHCDVPAASQHSGHGGLVPDQLLWRLARVLPPDVRVSAARAAPPEFDARFAALRRHYRYRVGTAAWGVNPLRSAGVLARPPRGGTEYDLGAMSRAAASLLGLRDFAAFCKAPQPGATTVRELQRFHWYWEQEQLLVADLAADAFCHSMVRGLVGALLAVGEGRRDEDWPARLLTEERRSSEITVAPAHGLSLRRVDYPPDEELAARAARTRARRG